MNEYEFQGQPSRRDALRALGGGFGWLALGGLTSGQDGAALHHRARAKRVIFLCMAGGPSHVDTFDYKPELARNDGKSVSASGRRGAELLASPWSFSPVSYTHLTLPTNR